MTCTCGKETNFTDNGNPTCMNCLVAGLVKVAAEDSQQDASLAPQFNGQSYEMADSKS